MKQNIEGVTYCI